MSPDLVAAFRDQIAAELSASHQYVQMSAHLAAQNLPGAASWMRVQADEERDHALKLLDHLLERGAGVQLTEVASPRQDFGSLVEVFRHALAAEEAVTAAIHELFAMAEGEHDYASFPLLQWFITEQVEEENTVQEIIHRLERIGDDGPALVMLDAQLGGRSEA